MITCIFENGNKNSLRHITVDVLVLKRDKILLVKRHKTLLEGGKWGLVGGFLERDETLQQAVQREIFEETGYKVKDVTLLTIRDNPDRPNEDRQNVAFVFFCKALTKEGESDWEVDREEWFSLHALPARDQVAFDHYENIQLFLRYKEHNLTIPILQ